MFVKALEKILAHGTFKNGYATYPGHVCGLGAVVYPFLL